MQYDSGKHCVFYHRYHLVWLTKYQYKVLHEEFLEGDIQTRVRSIIRQFARKTASKIARRIITRSRPHVRICSAKTGDKRPCS